MSTAATATFIARLDQIRKSVQRAAESSGRDASAVTIVAVSKTANRTAMVDAYNLGLRHFGENRVMEARSKLTEPMPADCTLHLIGQLQTNKVRHAVELFQMIDSVDRASLLNELERQAANRGMRLPILLQVNVAGETQKAGCAESDTPQLVAQIRSASNHLDLQGLMTMAPLVDDPDDVRPVFSRLRELRDRLQQVTGAALPMLSMGMSNDFMVAIQEGATHIRIGRAIFG